METVLQNSFKGAKGAFVNICFVALHPYWGGLSNGGGSKTIIKSVEVLNEIGQNAYVASVSDNFTWFDHRETYRKIPRDTDVVIACSVSDIKYTIKYPKRFYWARGLEKWQMPKKDIIENARKTNVLVNAEHLKVWYKKHGVKSKILYQGIDEWKDLDLRGEKITIGCLYSKRKTKRWKHFRKLASILGPEYRYVSYGTARPKEKFIDMHIKSPDRGQLEKIYSQCHIWFAPTLLEGLHNPPMEAALCGCLIVCSRDVHNGMHDYANERTAVLYKDINDAVYAIQTYKNCDYSNKVYCMQQYLKSKINTRKHNMEKLIGILSK